MAHADAFVRIPIGLIDPGRNIRLDDDQALDSLIASIKMHGVLQPITVVPHEDGGERVECLFGHRRLAAARAAGLDTMPCIAKPRGGPQARVLTQLAENRDRKAMSVLEEALVYRELRDLGMTQYQIAAAVGVNKTDVSKRLILLAYPDIVQRYVHNKTLGLADAIAIPLELAERTDGRALGSVCRKGGAHVRAWVRQQIAAEAAKGRTIEKRTTYRTVNIDSDLEDDITACALDLDMKVVEWVRRALRQAVLEQRSAS